MAAIHVPKPGGSAGQLQFNSGGTSFGAIVSTIHASVLPGIVADADVVAGTKYGGGTPTDNTSVLQTVISSASSTNPIHLIIDGGFGITSLNLAGGFITVEGKGFNTGFVSLATLTTDVITGTSASYVTLRNFRVNGGRTSLGTDPAFFHNIYLAGCEFVTIENVMSQNAACYNMVVNDCSNVIFNGCYLFGTQVTSPSGDSNQDGIHVDGGSYNIRINNCYFQTGDDAIALNFNENAASGRNIQITNCTFNSCFGCIRYYAPLNGFLDGLTISNCVAFATQVYFFKAGVEPLGYNSTAVHRNASISNCQVNMTNTAPHYFAICGNLMNLQVDNFTMVSPPGGCPLLSLAYSATTQAARIVSATFSNLKIHYDSAGYGADILYDGSFPIDELTIDGFEQVCDPGVVPGLANALIHCIGAYGGNRLHVHKAKVRFAHDFIRVDSSQSGGFIDAIDLTDFDGYGLNNGYPINFVSGRVPQTVRITGRNAYQGGSTVGDASFGVGVGAGQTLLNLDSRGFLGLNVYTGTVTNSITCASGAYAESPAIWQYLVEYWRLFENLGQNRIGWLQGIPLADPTDYTGVAPGQIGYCAQFQSNEYLTAGTNTALAVVGNAVGFFWGCRFQCTALPAAAGTLVSRRYLETQQIDYVVHILPDGSVSMQTSDNSGTGGHTNALAWGTLITGTTTWHTVICYYDVATTKMGIAVDGGNFTLSANVTYAPVSSGATDTFTLGGLDNQTECLQGTIDCAFVGQGYIPTNADSVMFYNGGAGWDLVG